MKINENDEVSVGIVNKKIEAFVEVIVGKMMELQQDNKMMKARINKLEKAQLSK